MKSFLHGKKSVSVPALWANGCHGHPTPPPLGERKSAAPAQASARPAIEVVKEGDKVVRIYVTCSCGERIELECLYPAGA